MISPNQPDNFSESDTHSQEIPKKENPDTTDKDFDHLGPIRPRPEGKKSALHIALKGTPTPAASQSELLPAVHEAVVMTKYTVYWFNQKDNDKKYQLIIEWPHVINVKEAMRDVIPYFNQRLADDNSDYILMEDPTQYEFFKAKKSGKPKVDYPSLDANQPLSTTFIQELTLVERSSNAVMLRNDLPPEDDTENTEKLYQDKENKLTMARSILPGPGTSYVSNRDTEEYIEETFCCFCIPWGRKVVKYNPQIHKEGDLRQKFVQN